MSKKVLIVDDDPDVRMFNATVVEESGYTPIEAPNGEEGLDSCQKRKTRSGASGCADAQTERYPPVS
jgi:CheY-like chemotaxis protein